MSLSGRNGNPSSAFWFGLTGVVLFLWAASHLSRARFDLEWWRFEFGIGIEPGRVALVFDYYPYGWGSSPVPRVDSRIETVGEKEFSWIRETLLGELYLGGGIYRNDFLLELPFWLLFVVGLAFCLRAVRKGRDSPGEADPGGDGWNRPR